MSICASMTDFFQLGYRRIPIPYERGITHLSCWPYIGRVKEKELKVDLCHIMLMKALVLCVTHCQHPINVSFSSYKWKSLLLLYQCRAKTRELPGSSESSKIFNYIFIMSIILYFLRTRNKFLRNFLTGIPLIFDSWKSAFLYLA